MKADEKRKLETELVKMGLAGLDASGAPSGDLVDQIAAIVSAWKGAYNKYGEWIDRHKYLRDLFSECDACDRQAMYDALVPRLSFKAKSLNHYETMMAERVGNMVSKRAMQVTGDAPKPIEVGGNRYAAAPVARATGVIATVVCHRCRKVEKFVEPTAVSAMTAARRAGWTREKGINKETCPDCSVAVAETIVRLSRTETLAVYDRRACKLDA
jgi:hypothetical protein